MEGFYWGMLHPFSSGPQLLMLLALSLFIQQRLPESEAAFTALWTGCILGAAFAAFGIAGLDADKPLTLAAMLAGVSVASALKPGTALLWAAGGVAGLLGGYVSWPDPGPPSDMFFSGLGAIAGSILIVIIAGGGIELLKVKTGWPWLAIAVRVAGSWIAAISVLLGALLVRNSA
jgi:hydrogenase/urease accessory protein HupE